MRKTDKKIDNNLRIVLTEVCEIALKEVTGFQWLTHLVDYSNFPKSLQVVCIFDTNENLSMFMQQSSKKSLISLIEKKLASIDIRLKNIKNHVLFDTEASQKNKLH